MLIMCNNIIFREKNKKSFETFKFHIKSLPRTKFKNIPMLLTILVEIPSFIKALQFPLH